MQPFVAALQQLAHGQIAHLAIGIVPVVGDFFDFGWKANVRNLALLERYAQPGSTASRGDWIFVLGVIAVLFTVTVVPIIFMAWLLSRIRIPNF